MGRSQRMKSRTNQTSVRTGVFLTLAVIVFTTPASAMTFPFLDDESPRRWVPHPLGWCNFCCSMWDAYSDFTPAPGLSRMPTISPWSSTPSPYLLSSESVYDKSSHVSRGQICTDVQYHDEASFWSCACPQEWPHIASFEAVQKANMLYHSLGSSGIWYQFYSPFKDDDEKLYHATPYKFCVSHSWCVEDSGLAIDSRSRLRDRTIATSLESQAYQRNDVCAAAIRFREIYALYDDCWSDEEELTRPNGHFPTPRPAARPPLLCRGIWFPIREMITSLSLMLSQVVCLLAIPVLVGVLLRSWDNWIRPGSVAYSNTGQGQQATSEIDRRTRSREHFHNARDDTGLTTEASGREWVVVDDGGACGEQDL